MEFKNTTTTTETNTGDQMYTGLGYLPMSQSGDTSRKQLRRDKKENFYGDHYEEWATNFAQNYMAALNTDQLGFFYSKDSTMTFVQKTLNETKEVVTNEVNHSGAEDIYTHLQMFRTLQDFNVSLFRVQPCSDRKSIFFIMEGTLSPGEGQSCKFSMTVTLNKVHMRSIGEYRSPQFIDNQYFCIE